MIIPLSIIHQKIWSKLENKELNLMIALGRCIRIKYLTIEDKIVMKIQQEMDTLESSKSPSPAITYLLCSLVAVIGGVLFFLLLILL